MTDKQADFGLIGLAVMGQNLVLNINDHGDGDGNTYVMTASMIQRGGAAQISYSTLESVNLNSGSGSDIFDVATADSMNTTITTIGGADSVTIAGTGAYANTWLSTGTDMDTIELQATGPWSQTLVSGGDDNDAIGIGWGICGTLESGGTSWCRMCGSTGMCGSL